MPHYECLQSLASTFIGRMERLNIIERDFRSFTRLLCSMPLVFMKSLKTYQCAYQCSWTPIHPNQELAGLQHAENSLKAFTRPTVLVDPHPRQQHAGLYLQNTFAVTDDQTKSNCGERCLSSSCISWPIGYSITKWEIKFSHILS